MERTSLQGKSSEGQSQGPNIMDLADPGGTHPERKPEVGRMASSPSPGDQNSRETKAAMADFLFNGDWETPPVTHDCSDCDRKEASSRMEAEARVLQSIGDVRPPIPRRNKWTDTAPMIMHQTSFVQGSGEDSSAGVVQPGHMNESENDYKEEDTRPPIERKSWVMQAQKLGRKALVKYLKEQFPQKRSSGEMSFSSSSFSSSSSSKGSRKG